MNLRDADTVAAARMLDPWYRIFEAALETERCTEVADALLDGRQVRLDPNTGCLHIEVAKVR
jgi:hypothetical protein